jgi:hypothetical protein
MPKIRRMGGGEFGEIDAEIRSVFYPQLNSFTNSARALAVALNLEAATQYFVL